MKVKVLVELEAEIPGTQEIDRSVYEALQNKVFLSLTETTFTNMRFNSTAVRAIYKKE